MSGRVASGFVFGLDATSGAAGAGLLWRVVLVVCVIVTAGAGWYTVTVCAGAAGAAGEGLGVDGWAGATAFVVDRAGGAEERSRGLAADFAGVWVAVVVRGTEGETPAEA